MSYKVLPQAPRSERTFWSPERGGRVRQKVGENWVTKFSFSPFTAKPRERYQFYADITMREEIESPPDSGKKRKTFTLPVVAGTYLEFRDAVLSGEVEERIRIVVEEVGGGEVVSVSYWRNRGIEPEI